MMAMIQVYGPKPPTQGAPPSAPGMDGIPGQAYMNELVLNFLFVQWFGFLLITSTHVMVTFT